VLDAALGAAAGPGGSGVDAGAAAAVLGLVELPVDDALQRDEDDAEEQREEDDAHVRLQVPLLQEQGVKKKMRRGGGHRPKKQSKKQGNSVPRNRAIPAK
jgi:hypothetical protein